MNEHPFRDERVITLATKVMGWVWDNDEGAWSAEERGGYVVAGWNPIEDIADAFEVVKKLSADGLPLELKEQTDHMTWEPVYIARFGPCQGAEAPITQPARVIANAALEAVRCYYE